MIRSSFMVMFLICAVCSFCGKDFTSLGRHSWRCKQRVNPTEQTASENPTREMPDTSSPKIVISSRTVVKCCCGKICKGHRGLKMHQRSCQVIHGLNNELCENLEENMENNDTEISTDDEVNTNSNMVDSEAFPMLKKGVNLPKKDSEWATPANDLFISALFLNGPITSHDLSTSIQSLNDTIYNYFATNFGYTETVPEENVINKYKDLPVKDLKKALRNLKSTNSDLTGIRYVSRILRDKLRNDNIPKSDLKQDVRINHDKYFQRNFWGYVKNVFEKKRSVLPTFTMLECFNYFKKTFAAVQPTKLFRFPSWIPTLCNPEIPFNLDPPTYQQVTSVIRKMKAFGSPCPLDQLSIICFKRCPFLRTHLTELLRSVWLYGSVAAEWKKACTILIHKKDDANKPSNFRPITLETVP